MPRNLVVDARALHGSGIGRHVREVTSRLVAGGAFDVTLAGDPADLDAWCSEISAPATTRVLAYTGGRYSLASQAVWPRLRRAIPRDAVVWFPHWDVPLTTVARPTVVTVHDLIHLRVPGAAGLLTRTVAMVLLRTAVRRARTVVTVSDHTRADLDAFEPAARPKIRVVHGGVARAFLDFGERAPGTVAAGAPGAGSPGAGAPYLLVVANRKPHKNLEAAVDVFARLRRDDPSLTLVVAGEVFPHWREILARAARLGVDRGILDLGVVPDETLARLYAGAECLLLSSRYEGFGLPVLEAMACGTPVVAANTASIPEVAGGAAVLRDPGDVEGMATAIATIRRDRSFRDRLVASGRARAASFTWDRTAEAMEEILVEAGR